MAQSQTLKNRKELHDKLITICPNVYYQPPSNVKMTYPCIRYEVSQGQNWYADNQKYHQWMDYQIMVISRDPDSDIPRNILELPYSHMENHYVAENLHHSVITLTTKY